MVLATQKAAREVDTKRDEESGLTAKTEQKNVLLVIITTDP